MEHSPVIVRLKEALDCVTLLDYTSKGAERTIWSTLYYAASKEGSTLPILFPETNVSALPKSWDQATSSETPTDFYKSKNENVTHIGRNCGRKFKKGEPIYRCLDCSFDNTCVLCVHCFNKDDHVGHQVNASICSGSNTGICDCGDPEAWKRELHCKCNSKASEKKDDSSDIFNGEYELYLQGLYELCLDFIIEVFAHQNQTLPPINGKLKDLVSRGGDFLQAMMLFKKDIEKSEAAADTEEKCVVLWNDEFHNFHEAQTAIISATHDNRVAAKRVAGQVDKEGRTMLLRGNELDKLVTGFANVQLNGLTASIMSVSDFTKQYHTKHIIDWILDTTNFPNQSFQTIARRALCKSLCSKFNPDTLEESVFAQYYTEDSGLLNNKNLPFVNHETVTLKDQKPNLTAKLSELSTKSTKLASQTRLQYLLFFDLRYWKTLRKKVHDLLIPPLVSDLEYKAIATEQIVEIYGILISNLANHDREPHINALDEIACQFFTCPTNSSRIVGTDKVRDVLYPIVHVFESYSIPTGSNSRNFKIPERFMDKSTSKRKSFTRTINDLTYIFEKTSTLDNFYHPENFISICYLLRLFDSNWKIQRKVGEHVETETYDFVDYFSYTLQLLAVVYAASDSTKLDPVKRDVSIDATQQLLRLLSVRAESLATKVYKSYNLIDFQVSKEHTGFMNPSNVLLSRLLQCVSKSFQEAVEITKDFDLLRIADSSLNAIVLSIQIESQFWVRNGLNALKQAYTYKSPQLVHESVYYRDIHLTQMSLMVSDPERSFLNILNRFELLDWFCNKIQLDNTVYEDKVFLIIEKLISFLYTLLSERSLFMEFESSEKQIRHKLKQVLIYTLYYKPLTYSEIEESLSEELAEFEFLDDVLNDVTTFVPPRGLNDDGRYILKPEYYKSVDPLKLLAQGKDFQDNTTILAKTLAAANGNDTSPEDIIIEPKLAKVEAFKALGDFTRTSEFAKLIYKLLEYAVQNNQESYVPQLLHLLHATFKDDEMINGKSHVIDSFIQIPVCESLFSVATSPDFSKQTTKKADHLLEALIVKSSKTFFESLVSCFGEDAVNQYKEKKKSVGVNFDETEPERKRRIAKERQKKILEKMSKKQKLFIQKNDLETQEDENESAAPEDTRHCVLCQGPESNDELFGLPISYVKSGIFRKLPLKDKHTIQRAFMNWENDCVGGSQESVGLGFPVKEDSHSNISSHQIATSCNHGMHYRCLKTFMTEHNYSSPTFACPLCKTFHNNYLPVYMMKGTVEQENLERNGEPVLENIVDAYMERPNEEFTNQYEESMKIVLGKLANEEEEDKGKIEYLQKTLKIFSSSMAQSEISTRINGCSSYTNFLTQIPEQTYRVMRGLFQSLMLFQKQHGYHKTIDLNLVDVSKDVAFMEHLLTDFYTGTSRIRDQAQRLLARDANQYLVSLLHRVKKYGDFNVPLDGKVASDAEINIFRASICDLPVAATLKDRFLQDDSFARQIVSMVEFILLPQLRTLCIFYKVLFPNFSLLSIEEYDYNDLNLLLKSTGLPSFREIIASPQNSCINPTDLSGNLPFPGVIKLIDLPNELNYFTTTTDDGQPQRFKPEGDVQNSSHRIDFSICLTCGKKVFKNDEGNEKILHMKNNTCDSGPDALFLIPNTDVVNLMSSTIIGHYSKVVNAPYLNSHGQSGVKAVQNGQIAKLNIERYKYLNNLWLTGSIFSYLSRNSSPILPRFGLENIAEERFWQQFLTNARTDLEQNLDDDQPFVFTFPPGANYVDEMRGPGMDMDSESSDEEDHDEEIVDHEDWYGEIDDDNEDDEIFREGEDEALSHSEYDFEVDDDIDEDDVDEMNFTIADDMEVEELENDSSGNE